MRSLRELFRRKPAPRRFHRAVGKSFVLDQKLAMRACSLREPLEVAVVDAVGRDLLRADMDTFEVCLPWSWKLDADDVTFEVPFLWSSDPQAFAVVVRVVSGATLTRCFMSGIYLPMGGTFTLNWPPEGIFRWSRIDIDGGAHWAQHYEEERWA